MKEYTLYKGDDLLAFGTIKEIAKAMRIKEKSVKFYGSKCYKRRLKSRKNSRNAKILIKID